MLKDMTDNGSQNKENWTYNIKVTLQECGLKQTWLNHQTEPINTSQIIQRITDIYQQSWYFRINNLSKFQSYSLFKHSYTREPYLDYITTKKYRKALTKLRVSSHSLHIETGRYINTPRTLRTCTNCNMNQPETEYHFILTCPKFKEMYT